MASNLTGTVPTVSPHRLSSAENNESEVFSTVKAPECSIFLYEKIAWKFVLMITVGTTAPEIPKSNITSNNAALAEVTKCLFVLNYHS